MKKTILGVFIMMMGLFFVSCGGEKDLKTVVESAQKDGANWTEDEWKDAFKSVMKASKPMLEEAVSFKKEMEGKSEEEQFKIAAEIMEKMEKFTELQKQITDFNAAAEKTEIGKKLIEDDNFQKEAAKELGMEKLMEEM
ncbi:hypothetical protein [Prevotella sp. OH937_COT-195]|uniref:hypothetical protein n=1 Tax=Prevotella sp. OH937_COT-195 TaxID=2491051 RepID=UPI000F648652|nr:hypothetical protein [Prevotella sp. OH937_COT-195]RRC99510.1 hypothetical protein EII32_07840 [Prevotella sp. OH937_COT-195]